MGERNPADRFASWLSNRENADALKRGAMTTLGITALLLVTLWISFTPEGYAVQVWLRS